MTPAAGDLPFDLVASVLQQISSLKPIPVARRLSKTTSPPPAHRPQILALLKPLFALDELEPSARAPVRVALVHLLLPHLDVERRYDLKERKLGQALARELGLDAYALEHWDSQDFWGGQYARREVPVCLGEVVGRQWERRRDPYKKGTNLSLLKVDALLHELAAHSRWSSSYTRGLYPKPRPVPALLKLLFPPSLSTFQASLLTQVILRDITPLLAPPPTAQRTVSLKEYDSKSRYLLDLPDVLRLVAGPVGILAWQRRGDIRQALAALERSEAGAANPSLEVGVNVQIPKCQKTVNLQRSLEAYARDGVDTLWAETKYDGERMQIHVDLDKPSGKQLAIFSKSKRDSTKDRISTHATIFSALALPSPLQCSLSDVLQRRAAAAAQPGQTVSRSVILEAEMVPFSERTGKIEEFWKIVQCPGDSRAAWRKSGRRQSTDARSGLARDESQPSQKSGSDLHLQLVFFDILELDGEPLIERTYAERRATLEQVVRVIPGWSMLAARLPMHVSRGVPTAVKELEAAFGGSVERFEEGLVLKPASATYVQHHWQKLKRDYIPGLGDTVDLVLLGASWDAQRARELNVAPTILTSFHVGVRIQSPMSRPRFLILFKASYGLTRDALEHWNAWFDGRCTPWTVGLSGVSTLGHAVEVPAGVSPPSVLLKQPLLVELYGASFQKIASSSHYELRWPRIQKIYPPKSMNGGKAWTEAMSADEYRSSALKALGRESSDVRSCFDQRLESQRSGGQESLDIATLFSPPPAAPATLHPPSAPSALRSSSRTSIVAPSSVASFLRPVSTCHSGPAHKRKRSHDENWSQRSTTREPSTDGEDSLPWSLAPSLKVVSPKTAADGLPQTPQPAAQPKRPRVPLQAASTNIALWPSTSDGCPAKPLAAAPSPAKALAVEDSAICLDGDLLLNSPSQPPCPPRPVRLVGSAVVDGADGLAAPPKPCSSKIRTLAQAESTLRHVLRSSLVHLPAVHDAALQPARAEPLRAYGVVLGHTLSSPEKLRRSTSSGFLDRLALTRSPSFREMLLQQDQDAVLLLNPDSPRLRRDLEAYAAMARAITRRRATVRVLNAWCLREKECGMDGSWERFRLAEL